MACDNLACIGTDGCTVPFASGNPGQTLATLANGSIGWVEPDSAQSELCTALDAGTAQPDKFLTVRDPGTGCQVEQFMPFAGLLNAGAALPISEVSHTQGDLIVNGGLYFAESDDIMPRRGADGAWYFYEREIIASGGMTTPQAFGANGVVIVNYDRVDIDTHGRVTPGANWIFTAPVSGIYQASFGIAMQGQPLTGPSGGAIQQALIGYTYINGAVDRRIDTYDVQSTFMGNLQVYGSIQVILNAGDNLSFALYLHDATASIGVTALISAPETYFRITRD